MEKTIIQEATSDSIITEFLLFIVILSPFAGSIFFYLMALWLNPNVMPYHNYLTLSYIFTLCIVGAYQLFFWVQRNNAHKQSRILDCFIDEKIPFVPQAVWLYSVGYYFFIGLMLIYISSLEEATAILFAGMIQLALQCLVFFFYPTTTPSHYRDYSDTTLSTHFLKVVQKLDNGRCCYPSLHCSAMMFVSQFFYPHWGILSYLIVISVTLSCVLVKQHLVRDFIPSVPIALFSYFCIYYPLMHWV